jgi:glutathione S-transferase
VPSLESLFWHPMLTYQYTFHTNISSYQDTSKSNAIFGILGRNGLEVASRVASNLVSIVKERERYASSKENLKRGLEELASACISKQGFFGGDKPSRLDFYLLAQLKTRSGSHLFLRFL